MALHEIIADRRIEFSISNTDILRLTGRPLTNNVRLLTLLGGGRVWDPRYALYWFSGPEWIILRFSMMYKPGDMLGWWGRAGQVDLKLTKLAAEEKLVVYFNENGCTSGSEFFPRTVALVLAREAGRLMKIWSRVPVSKGNNLGYLDKYPELREYRPDYGARCSIYYLTRGAGGQHRLQVVFPDLRPVDAAHLGGCLPRTYRVLRNCHRFSGRAR